jgi:tRNA A-37 threonylcarbamoyl transferase component Bud32
MVKRRKNYTKKRRLRGGTKKSKNSSSNNNNDEIINVRIQSPDGDIIHKNYEPFYAYIRHLRLDVAQHRKAHLNTIQITTDDEKEPLPNTERLVHNKLYYAHYTHNNHPYTRVYAKHVSDLEYRITMEMSQKGVSPRVLQAYPTENNGNHNNSNALKWTIVMESWPMTWRAYQKTDKYRSTRDILLQRLLEKIQIAHQAGIYHDDLTAHKDNVMVDVDRMDVTIIDWGQAMFIDKIRSSNIKNIVNSKGLNHNTIKTSADLVSYEYEYVKENY